MLESRFLEDKTYCFISVTGRTKSNIELARRATESWVRTITVTLSRNSKLAEVRKEVVPLKITKVNTPTAGFRTCVANVVTCLQIAGVMVPKNFYMWHKKVVELSLNLLDPMIFPAETVYLLGNSALYALALYASLQMEEFFGTTPVLHKLEEFCHSPIFGPKSHYLFKKISLSIDLSAE